MRALEQLLPFSQETAPMTSLAPDARERIESLLREGRKIEAIKVYREASGSGLAEAKAAVEQIDAAASSNSQPATSMGSLGVGDPVVIEEVAELVRAGRKIEAIKRYREATGLGLAESKAAVDAFESQQPTPTVPAVKTSSGCLGLLLVGVGGLIAKAAAVLL
jgi:ribosomal protein L7/L12